MLKLDREEFEMLHAEIIDKMYLEYKDRFHGPHPLGQFKESVKMELYELLNLIEQENDKKNYTKKSGDSDNK